MYGQELTDFIEREGYPWFRVGVVVRNEDGKYLCTEEQKGWKKVTGHWNIPSGQVDTDEDIFHAALREVLEETGYRIKLIGVCQIGQRTDRNNLYIMITFAGQALRRIDSPDAKETKQVRWLSKAEIDALDEAGEIRNHDFMIKSIRNLESGLVAPLGIVDIYAQR